MRIALTLVFVAGCFGADLGPRLTKLVESAPASVRGIAGIHVVELATGKVVYSLNEDQLLLPASNLKLFTAALALSRLRPDYRMETKLVREASGNVVLIGAGDPSLSGRAYPYDAKAALLPSLHAVDELVEQAVAMGLRRVEGDVVGDDQRYPWSPYPESWTADDVLHGYGAPVSALAVNDNVVTITVRAAARAGELAHVELDPPFEYFQIDSRVTTGSGALRVARVPGTRQVLLSGSVRAGTSASETIAVDDPALFAAHALYESLLRHGVAVRGRPVARHHLEAATGTQLAVRQSPPLEELLRTTLKVSQNLHAEMLLREVGLRQQGQGTVDAGLRELKVLLGELKIAPAALVSEDGSGLARNDEVTPRAVTQLLAAMDAGDLGELWRGLLPVGGQDGTLSNRLCCVAETVGIRAKTGSLSRAVALSGYADGPANGRLAFSILVNNFSAPAAEVRAWVDRLASALVE